MSAEDNLVFYENVMTVAVTIVRIYNYIYTGHLKCSRSSVIPENIFMGNVSVIVYTVAITTDCRFCCLEEVIIYYKQKY